MNKKTTRRVLGRGLSALIPTQTPDGTVGEQEIVDIDCAIIRPNPFQPRTEFDHEGLQELADSISSQGLQQPILVRQKGDSEFEIISGERRFRALLLLGKNRIPCIVKSKISDREMMEIALVENIQREDLNEIDKADQYQKLISEYNYTHDTLAKQIGISRSALTNTLRLRTLPQEIQQMLKKKVLSMGHARALLSIQDNKHRIELAKKIIEDELTVRDIERKTQKSDKKEKTRQKMLGAHRNLDPNISDAAQRLQYLLGTAVTVNVGKAHKGTISIDYFSEKDLIRIFDILLGGTAPSSK